MTRLALAALCAPLLLVAPAQAGATFPTLIQARAAYPTAHIHHRNLDDGQRCWYAGRKPSKQACALSMRRDPLPPILAILCGGKCNRNISAIEWRPRAPVLHVALMLRYWP
jgi:hypothetical protein